MTKLGDLLDLTRIDDPTGTDDSSGYDLVYRARIDQTFTIGPKVHGGSVQMLAAKAAREALLDLADPDARAALEDVSAIAIASDYLAAPDPAEVDVAVSIVKRGRTVNLARVDVTQGGRTMVSSAVTLGRVDTGEAAYRLPGLLDGLPVEPADDGLSIDDSALGDVMHLGPALDMVLDAATFAAGRGERGDPVIRGWIRPKEAADQPSDLDRDFPVLVCDVSPPVLMNLGMFGWAPTVQLTTFVRRRPAAGWLRFESSTHEVGKGMFDEDHVVLDSTGAVVANSRQLALIPRRP
ncbi:thioesterase family protein [Gordonia sp. HY002]|uniref:thioesterase family protein n=1 Tax=Gordonia zhenghanii TaxID=2911516 RepID=UPI001EEF7B27|nr:thioesterase family protein [Gordonia zhenghanii]MCF8570035.1 thioesterase family protein [Gordonia zhenghanii]MCF8607078.1 thioesterase family protein [Gordonia zhenghanii]